MKKLKAGVMGDPVSHSLSPLLHGHWLKAYGIDGQYDAMHVSAEALGDALQKLREENSAGCNLTIPHKEAAFEWMDEVSDSAKVIGAINTVIQREGRLHGTNSDAEGFIHNLLWHNKNIKDYLDHCLIIGAGGAAKAVYYGLKQAGAKHISITNRNLARAQAFVDAEVIDWEHKEAAFSQVSLLVNTTSLGMKGQPPLTLSLNSLPKESLVTDIVYQPLMTDLLCEAKACGNPIVTGIGMLIHQAVPGFEAWFGTRPEVTQEIYDLLEGKLA